MIEALPFPVWPCKICGSSVTNRGENTEGENVPLGVCYPCFKSPYFHADRWRDRHYFEVTS